MGGGGDGWIWAGVDEVDVRMQGRDCHFYDVDGRCEEGYVLPKKRRLGAHWRSLAANAESCIWDGTTSGEAQ